MLLQAKKALSTQVRALNGCIGSMKLITAIRKFVKIEVDIPAHDMRVSGENK